MSLNAVAAVGGSPIPAHAIQALELKRNASKGEEMAARIKRDYGTRPCAYCGATFQKKMARSTCCCHSCQAMVWFDKNRRKGEKPRLIVEGVAFAVDMVPLVVNRGR